MDGWVGGWVIEEEKAVRMRCCCELGVRMLSFLILSTYILSPPTHPPTPLGQDDEDSPRFLPL